jgi:hypothetical protein
MQSTFRTKERVASPAQVPSVPRGRWQRQNY